MGKTAFQICLFGFLDSQDWQRNDVFEREWDAYSRDTIPSSARAQDVVDGECMSATSY